MALRSSSDYVTFNKLLINAKNIVVLTGAGISAESGLEISRGPSGMWRNRRVQDLASLYAFRRNPSLVWEFYHGRRETVFKAEPNKAHTALAKYEEQCKKENRMFTIITQNMDGLHEKSGSKNLIEMNGSIRRVRCTECQFVEVNLDSPICEALRGKGYSVFVDEDDVTIPISDLPKCKICQGLLRPHIVWFGERVEPNVMQKCHDALNTCDLFLLIGTSSVVQPASSFAPHVLRRGIPVAEFNIEEIPALPIFPFYFPGEYGTTLPKAFGITL